MSSLTGDRGFVGTIDYVPPEQIAGGALDRRADVYSLGCVLFECLAGARPFERESELSVVFAHLNEPPPRLSDFRPELPRAFDDVFAIALAKSPDERYEQLRRAGDGGAKRASRRDVRASALAPADGVRRSSGAAVLVAAAAAGGALLATRGDPIPSPVGITQTSIAGATLGLTQAAYKELYGIGWRADVVTATGLPRPHLPIPPAGDLLRSGHPPQHHCHDLEPRSPHGGGDRPVLERRGAQVRVRERAEAVPLEHAAGEDLRLHGGQEPALRRQRPPAEPLEARHRSRALRRRRAPQTTAAVSTSNPGRCPSPASSR